MAFSYARLWRILRKREMTKTHLRKAAGFSTAILAKMGKDEMVSMDVIDKICRALSCDIGNIMEWYDENDLP